MTPVRVGVVVALLLAAVGALAVDGAIANSHDGAHSVAAVAAAVLGAVLALPRTPFRRMVVLPIATVAVAVLAVRASSTGVPGAVFGVFAGYFLANFLRVAVRVRTLARRAR
jgi:hypothetical protein